MAENIRATEITDGIINEVEKVIVGKHSEIILLMTALLSGGHVLIEDVPGVGKTTLASTLARASGLTFNRAQFTPDVMASDITGFNIYNRKTEAFDFREGLVMCNILLADEINRASPKTQSALLESMEEKRVTVDGKSYELPTPFMVIATQNPTGYVGTYLLPEAQLDRFAIKLTMGYPSFNEELNILKERMNKNPIAEITPVCDVSTLAELKSDCENVDIDEAVAKYIISLVSATRNDKNISLGASPRASLMLMKASQAYAMLHGRNYILPEDVATLFYPVISHRIMLTQEAKLAKKSSAQVLTDLIHRVEVPYRKTVAKQ